MGVAKCPHGHYEWHEAGTYAANVKIIINGNVEFFNIDDMYDDSKKLAERVKEIRTVNGNDE
jgi:hypothetical protein